MFSSSGSSADEPYEIMHKTSNFESWGRFPKVVHLGELVPHSFDSIRSIIDSVSSPVLPRGMGRSYGDSCLNQGGYLLSTRRLNKFKHFDSDTGILRCESGVTIDEILQIFVPRGWFPPVTPGTKFVTIGGAIANDVHGKNHHRTGAFGTHVSQFELERSDGSRILCSRENNPEWFRATIGGLGLTGIILWAELRLKPIHGPFIEMESIKFDSLDEFYQISHASEKDYEYTVSWLDCLNRDGIRGLFMRGNHIDKSGNSAAEKAVHKNPAWKTFPFDAPSFLLSRPTIRLLNILFYHKQYGENRKSIVHYAPFFYPLDNINQWNRMYGKRGFLQWQCVVPISEKDGAMRMILNEIVKSEMGSFLVVLKEFGDVDDQGMLSFPIPGITLALDIPNVGNRLFSLLNRLDGIVCDIGGKIYPAKDARMSSNTFQCSFPEFSSFEKYVDPKFSSSFYRRVRGDEQ